MLGKVLGLGILACLLSGSPPSTQSVYVLRYEGLGVDRPTYVGATTEVSDQSVLRTQPLYGGLAFWGPGGREQAMATAKVLRDRDWPCTVVEISGPSTDLPQ